MVRLCLYHRSTCEFTCFQLVNPAHFLRMSPWTKCFRRMLASVMDTNQVPQTNYVISLRKRLREAGYGLLSLVSSPLICLLVLPHDPGCSKKLSNNVQQPHISIPDSLTQRRTQLIRLHCEGSGLNADMVVIPVDGE